MSDALKLTSLEVENILRLKAVRLTLGADGALIIEGRNEQGKSSVLDSLEILLAGMSETPPEPLHGDEKKGHIIGTFGDVIVKKSFKSGKTPVLTVSTKDGGRMKAPQGLLDTLLDRVSLDPIKFMAADDEKKLRALSDLMGFDSSEYDAEYERLYNLRRDANREAKRLESVASATAFHEGTPDEEVSVSDLMEELQKRREHNNELARRALSADAAQRAVEESKRLLDISTRKVAEAEEMLRIQREALESDRETYIVAINDSKTATALAHKNPPADENSILEQITAADDINFKVRANADREVAKRNLTSASVDAKKFDAEMAKVEAEREKARLAARENLPVPDLDITSDAVLYKGKPLSQAGKSAQLRISVAIAIAANKDKRIKLLLIDDAEKLDGDNMNVVLRMAHDAGFQVIMARVGDGQKASVVIEDGEVKDA